LKQIRVAKFFRNQNKNKGAFFLDGPFFMLLDEQLPKKKKPEADIYFGNQH